MRFQCGYLLILSVIIHSSCQGAHSKHLSALNLAENEKSGVHWMKARHKSKSTGQRSFGLESLLKKIRDGRQLTLVAMGGSNTAGGGLVMSEKRYFEVVADWWNQEMYKTTGSKLDAHSMAITGTGSEFFSFCFQNFLPNQKNPDIVLLEFAINDSGDEYGKAAQPMEVLTRRLFLLPSKPLVIYVNLVNPGIVQGKVHNNECKNMQNMGFDELAKHYGIPSFTIKDIVCPLTNGQRVLDESKSEMFAMDGAHASGTGHNKIATMIIKYLKKAIANNLEESKNIRELNKKKVSLLPKPLFSDPSIDDDQLSKSMCWSHMTSNWKKPLRQTLDVDLTKCRGFEYNSPSEAQWDETMRTDANSGWMAKPGSIDFTVRLKIPHNASVKSVGVIVQMKAQPLFIKMSLNDEKKSCIEIAIKKATGDSVSTRLFPVATEVSPGNYTLHIEGKVKYLNMVGIVAGYRGYHGFKGYNTFEGNVAECSKN